MFPIFFASASLLAAALRLSFDCFCYESINEELLRLLRRRFNVFVCGKGLTDGTKCSLLQRSKIYCHSEEGDLIGKEIFEAGGCGKMVLCNEIPSKDGMDMFFEDSVHLVNYENIEDCLKKIDLYFMIILIIIKLIRDEPARTP